jgi:hypothetical protein
MHFSLNFFIIFHFIFERLFLGVHDFDLGGDGLNSLLFLGGLFFNHLASFLLVTGPSELLEQPLGFFLMFIELQ